MIRTRQPQGAARIRTYWLSRGLVFLFNGATFQDLVTGTFATNVGAVGRRANVNGSIGPDISGTQYLEFTDRDALDITAELSIFWRGVFDATAGAYRCPISKANGNGIDYTPFDVYVDLTSGKLAFSRSKAGGFDSRTVDTAMTAGVVTTFGVVAGPLMQDALSAYVNGSASSVTLGASGSGSALANIKGLRIGRRDDGATQLDGSVECIALFNKRLSSEEYFRLYRDPWGELLVPSRRARRSVQLGAAAGGGAVTGTASITQSPQTLTGAGTVAVAGTLNKTPAAQTATTAVAVAIAGTLNKTQTAQTVTTAGSVAVSGTFNKTPAAQTLTASGTVASGVTGTASITPAAQTVTGSGAVPIAATATITPSAQTATTSGAVQVAATATITPAAQTLAATGAVVSGVVGNASITPTAQTATASGTVAIAATATITPSPQTLSATAAVSGGAVTGTANIYVSAQTLVAAANIIVRGTATITPAPQTLLGLEAGTLPAEIPESSRTLSQMTERLGSEWVDTDPARLGLATARRSRPRLG
jgi:hypothetical protein